MKNIIILKNNKIQSVFSSLLVYFKIVNFRSWKNMIESISEFYKRIDRYDHVPEAALSKRKEYSNIQRSKCNIAKPSFSYRDFYSVSDIQKFLSYINYSRWTSNWK
jgi:hypothetical protein